MEYAALAGAIIAAASAIYGGAQQAKSQQRAKRAAANSSQMSGAQTGESPKSPTANRFAEGGNAAGLPDVPQGDGRLSDILGGKQATQPQQGMALADDHRSPDAAPPEAPRYDMQNAEKPMSIPVQKDLNVPAGTTTQHPNDYNQYAQIAESLYGAYNASKANRPQPGPLPQLGPMDLTPTAYRFR